MAKILKEEITKTEVEPEAAKPKAKAKTKAAAAKKTAEPVAEKESTETAVDAKLAKAGKRNDKICFRLFQKITKIKNIPEENSELVQKEESKQ